MTYIKIVTIIIAAAAYYYKRKSFFPILDFKYDFKLVVLIYIQQLVQQQNIIFDYFLSLNCFN